MSNLEMWSGIVGFLLPPAVAIVVQTGWAKELKAVMAFGLALVAAVGTVLIQQDGWDSELWVKSALTIVVTAIATYHGVWKPTGVAGAIESKTNLG